MNPKPQRAAQNVPSKAREIGVILIAVFLGPIVGTALAAFGVVLAPPQIILTGVAYMVFGVVNLPLAAAALILRWIRLRGFLLSLIAGGAAAIFYLALIGPWLPSGTTQCQPVEAEHPQVRYECVAVSSDDASYRDEFTLYGWSSWPLMRMVRAEGDIK